MAIKEIKLLFYKVNMKNDLKRPKKRIVVYKEIKFCDEVVPEFKM